MTGLTKPDSGNIKVLGHEVVFGKSLNFDTGYLPDVPNYYNWMRAKEFLSFVGNLYGIESKALDKRIDYLLEMVGLKGVKTKVGGYTRGMKQRLGIAQALINSPKIVFLDEPTSALDPQGRKEIMDLVRSLAGQATVFFSTHILADVERICDRIVIMDKGKTLLEGSMEDIKEQFSVNAVELIISDKSKIAEVQKIFTKEDWFSRFELVDNSAIKLWLKNNEKAAYRIPLILGEAGIGLERYNPVEPTLENVFIKVVGE
jgi:ABC-2 type transport system ATP-binding protein